MEKENSFMRTRPVFSLLVSMSVPMMLSMLIQSLYNIVDSIYVSRLGTDALTAVSLAYPLQNAIVSVGVGVGVGISSAVSIHLGAGDQEKADRSATLGVVLTFFHCILFILAGIFITKPFLSLFTSDPSILKDACDYTYIVLCLSFGALLQLAFEKIFQSIGKMKITMYLLIVGCVINIILDPILIFGLLGFPAMGVAGAAIATIFSQAVSAVLVTAALMRSDDIYQLQLREIRFFKQALISLIWIGLPAGIQSTMYSISNMVIQTSLNSLGTDTVAAWTAFGKIDSMYWMVNNSLGIAVTTFVGQNFGAGKYDRMKRSVRVGIGMGLVAAVAISGLFFAAGNLIFHLFTTDAGVISIGMDILRLMAPAYFLFVFIELLSGALRGTGDVMIPMLLTCGGVCVLRVVWILVVVPLYPGLRTIIFSYPVTWLITAVLFIIYYRIREKHFGEVRRS